jgi:hypothetical protein
MGPSFTGEAAQNREWRSFITPGRSEQQDFPRTLNITPSSVTRPSGPKAIRRLTISSVLHNLD